MHSARASQAHTKSLLTSQAHRMYELYEMRSDADDKGLNESSNSKKKCFF